MAAAVNAAISSTVTNWRTPSTWGSVSGAPSSATCTAISGSSQRSGLSSCWLTAAATGAWRLMRRAIGRTTT